MARRIPIEEPHLRWTDKQENTDPRIQRRRGIIPHQSTLSVQNIPDTSTPAGTAMVNEEFRRLRLAITGLQETKDVEPTVSAPSTSADTGSTEPALTVAHQDSPVVGNQVQIMNFVNSDTVQFYIEKDGVARKWEKYVIDQSLQNTELDKPQKVNVSARIKERFYGITGTVYINQLVVTEPSTYPDSDTYKYYPKNYDPTHGKYGWYVYQTIPHNLRLTHKDSYVMELIDLHDYDDRDGEMDVFYASRFETQQGIFEHEGLDADTIIIRAVFKPDLHYYYGTMLPQSLEYIDEPNGVVRTNLVFRYTIMKL